LSQTWRERAPRPGSWPSSGWRPRGDTSEQHRRRRL